MATTTIGALSVKITADNKGLKKGINGAVDDLKKGRRAINENAAAFAKWSTAGVTAAAAIGAAIFKHTANNVRNIKNLSFAANELTDEFQRGAFAAQQFGIEQEKYGDILKDVNDKVGDFLATGGGQLADFFENVAPKVNLTADAFRGLSGQEALGLYIKALQDANLSQTEMTFYMEAIANDSTRLLPLFKDNAAALNALTAEAEALGIGLNEVNLEKLEQASQSLDALGGVIEGMLQNVAAEFAPLIKVISDNFVEAAKKGRGFGNEIQFAFDLVVNSIGFVMDAVEGVKRTFQVLGRTVAMVVLGIQEGMLTAADFIVNRPIEAVNELIAALNRLPWHNIDPVQFSGFGETIKTELEVVRGAIATGMQDVSDIMAAPMPSELLKQQLEAVKAAAKELAEIKADEGESEALLAHRAETDKLIEDTERRYQTEQNLTKNNVDAISSVLQLGGKKTEKITKGIAIAQALVKGGESAVSAYAAGMSVGGPFAPATAALYAAASIANTTRMIQSIRSGGKSKPTAIRPSSATGGSEGEQSAAGGVSRNISINIGGQGFFSAGQVRELIEQINEQVGDGASLTASTLGG